MRISTKEVYLSGLQAVQQHTADIMRAQRQIATGEKYTKASDSPLAAGLGVQVILDRAQFEMFKVNQDFTNAKLVASDTQLKSITEGMLRIRQLMVQASNDLVPEQRTAINLEIDQIWKRIQAFATSKDSSGNALFEPVTPNAIANVLIAPSLQVRAGISYAEIMGQTTPVGPPEAGFTSLDSVLATITTRLGNRQAPSAQDWVDFDKLSSQVNEAAVKIGILQNHLEAATEASEVQKMNIDIEKSNLLDADLAETTSKLARSNALLQAAQSIMSRIDINNLFQKL